MIIEHLFHTEFLTGNVYVHYYLQCESRYTRVNLSLRYPTLHYVPIKHIRLSLLQ